MEHRVVYTAPNIRHVLYTTPYDSEIEYLESTGTQWIDTFIHPLTNYGFELYGGFTQFVNEEFFGGGIFYNKGLGICTHSTPQSYGVVVGTTEVCRINCINNIMHLFKVNTDGTVYVDGEYKGKSTTAMPNGSYTMNIFRLSAPRAGVPIPARIYYCKIYNTEGIVFDSIPVRKDNIGYMYDKVSGKLFGNKGTGNFILGNDVNNVKPKIRSVMPIRVAKEVHVTFGQFPFITNVDEVVYTQDINRRSKSTKTPKNITYTGQSFQVWAWTENNAREKLTCFIGCEYFYPQYGSKLFVHSNLTTGTNGILRRLKATSFEFCKCWDATYITSLQYAFKDTVVTDFSFLQDWKLINLNSFTEAFSQLGNRNVEPFMRCQLGSSSHRVSFGSNVFYSNHYTITTWDGMCRNWYLKLTTWGNNDVTFIPNCYHLDMTNWDLTEWNTTSHIFFTSDYYGVRVRKITTPILPLQTLPMKLPYAMYDMETEQVYTEIPLNLDRQLTLYKNKSDFGK